MWGRVTAYIIGGHSCQAEKEARGAGTGGGEHLPHTAPLGLDPQPSLGADPGLGCSACSLDSCHGAVSPGTRSGARTGCPSLRVVRVGQLGTPRNLQPQVCSVVRWGSQGPGKQWETWPGTQCLGLSPVRLSFALGEAALAAQALLGMFLEVGPVRREPRQAA